MNGTYVNCATSVAGGINPLDEKCKVAGSILISCF